MPMTREEPVRHGRLGESGGSFIPLMIGGGGCCVDGTKKDKYNRVEDLGFNGFWGQSLTASARNVLTLEYFTYSSLGDYWPIKRKKIHRAESKSSSHCSLSFGNSRPT